MCQAIPEFLLVRLFIRQKINSKNCTKEMGIDETRNHSGLLGRAITIHIDV